MMTFDRSYCGIMKSGRLLLMGLIYSVFHWDPTVHQMVNPAPSWTSWIWHCSMLWRPMCLLSKLLEMEVLISRRLLLSVLGWSLLVQGLMIACTPMNLLLAMGSPSQASHWHVRRLFKSSLSHVCVCAAPAAAAATAWVLVLIWILYHR